MSARAASDILPARTKAPRVFPAGASLVDLAADSVVVFDLDGRILSWNAGAEALYGWDASAAIGAHADALLSRPEPGPAPETLRRRTADGEEIVVKATWTPRLDAQGTPEAVIEFSRRVDAREVALDRLKASEERYRRLFLRAPVALMVDDPQALAALLDDLKAKGVTDLDAYIDANPAFLDHAIDTVALAEVNLHAVKLFGARNAAELVGPVRHFWPDAPGTFRRAVVALHSGASRFAEETRVRTLDGRTIDVLFSLNFSASEESSRAALNGMLDITALRQTEARLHKVTVDFTHAARLSTLGELTNSIAHEIQQPLAEIRSDAEAAQGRPTLDAARQFAERIVANAERISEIVGRVQQMSGKRDPARTSLDINDLVRECLVFVRHEAEENAVPIETALSADLPPILGDRVQLQQVVVNLLVNSLQAMRGLDQGPRKIVLTTFEEGGGVVFTIHDAGPGVAEEQLEKVFESFFTTKPGGLGIGLAVCHSIVAAHGGAISAANHPEGGALFRFRLPAPASEFA